MMKKNVGQTTKRQLQSLISVTAVMLGGLIVHFSFRSVEATPQDNCAAITNQIKGLESDRASLQKDLQKAAGDESNQTNQPADPAKTSRIQEVSRRQSVRGFGG